VFAAHLGQALSDVAWLGRHASALAVGCGGMCRHVRVARRGRARPQVTRPSRTRALRARLGSRPSSHRLVAATARVESHHLSRWAAAPPWTIESYEERVSQDELQYIVDEASRGGAMHPRISEIVAHNAQLRKTDCARRNGVDRQGRIRT
jgi:hypothetical protein